MKRNVCTASLLLRSAGVVLIAFGAVLSVFWPQIFDQILAGVGHGYELHKVLMLTGFIVIGTRAQPEFTIIRAVEEAKRASLPRCLLLQLDQPG